MSAESWAENRFKDMVAQNQMGFVDRLTRAGVTPDQVVVVAQSTPVDEAADKAAYGGGRVLAVVTDDGIDLYRIAVL